MRVMLPTLFLCFAVGSAAWAKEISTSGQITAVTVFPDRAEVVRSLSVDVTSGKQVVVVTGLPANLFQESVRVSGEGSVTIGAVELRPVYAEKLVREEERRLRERLQELQDERRTKDNKIAALRSQLDFITAIGREMPKNATEEIVRGDLNPESWKQAWTMIGEGAAESYERIHAAEIEKREIEERMAQVQRELSQVATGRKATLEARVKVSAAAPTSVRLDLSYQLPGASWRPIYDARLESESGKLTLAQIGEVRQRTGEDWNDVDLMLSTAQPGRGSTVPELHSWFIDFGQPEVVEEQYFSKQKESSGVQALGQFSDALQPAPAPPPADVAHASVNVGEFAATYQVTEKASLPSDNSAHKFPLTEQTLQAQLAVRSVPTIVPFAYLLAKADYGGETTLLPGPIALFRDGAFVGNSHLKLLSPGEDVKLSYGIDDKVQVTYRLDKGERSQEGIINKDERLERRYRIEVTNFHAQKVRVTVMDHIPVPQDERIKVEVLRETPKPTDDAVDDRRGVMAWTREYEPGEKRSFIFGYAVTFPKGAHVPGF